MTPHDLRRTFARLARKGGSDLNQIKELLDHAAPRGTAGSCSASPMPPADRLGLNL